jgi:hypothetical protein
MRLQALERIYILAAAISGSAMADVDGKIYILSYDTYDKITGFMKEVGETYTRCVIRTKLHITMRPYIPKLIPLAIITNYMGIYSTRYMG